MSASTATARVIPEQATVGGAARAGVRQPVRQPVRPARPRLRVVPAPRRSATGLALLCVTLLGFGLLVLLLLNINIGKGAYELTALQAQQRELADQRQALAEQVEAESAPQKLAAAAKKLGMVPNPTTAFVDPADGAIQGSAGVATAPPKPAPTAKATTKATTKATAKAKTPAKTAKTADKTAKTANKTTKTGGQAERGASTDPATESAQ